MLNRFRSPLSIVSSQIRTMASTTTTNPTGKGPIKIENHETYLSQGIPSPSALDPNPLTQFQTWFQQAISDPDVPEPEAMSISTVSASGVPSTRTVLLKRADDRGFIFFTNYGSRKGKELFPNGFQGENPSGGYASLAFYWRALHLSVRVVGRAEKLDAQGTKEYFDSRPVGSRIGAWASAQSSELTGREELEEKVRQLEKKFGVKEGTSTNSSVDAGGNKEGVVHGDKDEKEIEIPVPPFWGGVRIVPFEVEFWAGRPSRLHDRMRYTREEGADTEWKVVRLSP